MAYVPGTATTIGGMGVPSIAKIAYDSKLRQDSVRPSIWTEIKTTYKINDMGEVILGKPGVLLDISNVGRAQSGQSVKVSMRMSLKKRGMYGDGEDVLGNEDESTLLVSNMYYNEIKKGVKYNTYGYAFNDTEYLNFTGGYDEALALWHQENDDDRIQQAFLLGRADELTYSPVSQTQPFNKNWIIPNLPDSQQPAWSVIAPTPVLGAQDSDRYYSSEYYNNGASFSENIAAAMLAASGTSAVPVATMTVDHMMAMHNYEQYNHLIEPVMVDGVPSKFLCVADFVKHFMLNPSMAGSFGSYWAQVAQYKDPKLKLPGEMGRFMDDWVVIHDTRSPTMVISGQAGAYHLKPGFLHPGNNDDRDLGAWSASSATQNFVWDICKLVGANALCIYRRDELVTGLEEFTEYKKRKGSSTYKGEGLQLPIFDLDTPSSASTIYRGSAIIPISRHNVDVIVTP